MVGFSSQTESWVATRNSIYESQKEADSFELDLKRLDLIKIDQEDEDNNINNQDKISTTKKNKKKNQVLLEGYVEAVDEEDELKRTKSLTDDDLDELKGCLDLGFGFSYEEIPELCNTLPALELCYSMSQKYLDDHQHHASPDTTATPEPVANWKISSPVMSINWIKLYALPNHAMVGMTFPAIVGNRPGQNFKNGSAARSMGRSWKGRCYSGESLQLSFTN
ncbi:tyrS [Gossypium arboreum]|uniref:TyrS n=1 Tax=Gossypium arboreum TaxID=29729 RepID=A0A0B0N401_GOSAR|nr:tyrS [Gossypium arboreum]